MTRWKRWITQPKGATAAEYIVALILTALFVLGIVKLFGGTVEDKFSAANSELAGTLAENDGANSPGGGNPSGDPGGGGGRGGGGDDGSGSGGDGSGAAGKGGSGSKGGKSGKGGGGVVSDRYGHLKGKADGDEGGGGSDGEDRGGGGDGDGSGGGDSKSKGKGGSGSGGGGGDGDRASEGGSSGPKAKVGKDGQIIGSGKGGCHRDGINPLTIVAGLILLALLFFVMGSGKRG